MVKEMLQLSLQGAVENSADVLDWVGAGAVVLVVGAFLSFLLKRGAAEASAQQEREKRQQEFMSSVLKTNQKSHEAVADRFAHALEQHGRIEQQAHEEHARQHDTILRGVETLLRECKPKEDK